MNAPAELKYTREHEWVKVDANVAIIGITDYAQGELGDIVFVEFPSVGDELKQNKPFGTIEAVKAVSDMYAPISGKVLEINSALDADPTIINRDPYGDGWMIKLQISNENEIEELLDSEDYQQLVSKA